MKRLPATATDDDILRWVGEWGGLLAEERYQDAYDALFHPKWVQMTPEAMEAIRRTDPWEWEKLRHREDLYELGTDLPDGLSLYADGEDVRGSAPWGHRTIYTTKPISFDVVVNTWNDLP